MSPIRWVLERVVCSKPLATRLVADGLGGRKRPSPVTCGSGGKGNAAVESIWFKRRECEVGSVGVK